MATKKTKTVETPIDQRETFMSIQKSFADSDIPVEEKLRTLHALQCVDTEIDKIFQLRGELPLEVETLEDELSEVKAKEAALENEVTVNLAAIEESKHNIAECEAQSAKYKAQLDTVSNSREYDSLQKELENQDLLRQIAEKTISEAKERNFDLKQKLEALKQKEEVKTDDLKAKQAELATIVASTAEQEKKLVAAREQYISKIDARTLSAYDRIRASVHNHLAVVGVYNGNACGGCMNTIPPQRLLDIATNSRMIVCEYCGRILMNPGTAE